MEGKTDYEISIENWVKEQKNLIDVMQNNIDYLKNEIKLKTISLQLNIMSLKHEKQALGNHLSKQIENGK